MSHFAVAVFCHTDDGAELERLLAPYQENNMGDCPKEYLAFVEDEDCDVDEETGKRGYWENPNAKWDWWQIGGRYYNWFKTKDGRPVNYGQIGELDFSPDQEQYQHAIRFWEINVEGAPLQPDEDKEDFFNFYRPEYYREQYGAKEEYATSQADLAPWAFVTADGAWCEKGRMGWWACNDATKDSRVAFREAFHKALQDAAPTDYIVLVDCHI